MSASSRPLTIALAGNPNSGKSTLFNAITGLRQHVGNYPGVTVEKKEGSRRVHGLTLRVVDLPGTYSLTAYSQEEIVAQDFLLDQRPDVVVDVIDSSNLQRNLYLAVQLLESGRPLVLALNMADVAEAAGQQVDATRLSKALRAPVVPTIAHKAVGIDALMEAAVSVARQTALVRGTPPKVDYGPRIESALGELMQALCTRIGPQPHLRWLAVKLLEGDSWATRRLGDEMGQDLGDILSLAQSQRETIETDGGESVDLILAKRRHAFAAALCAECVPTGKDAHPSRSDRIDSVLAHPRLGLPIFIVMMLTVFQTTFWLGNPLVNLLDSGKTRLADWVHGLGGPEHGPALLQSLVADGIIEGVGAVVQFVPLISLLFLAISILEDSGYMARAAFLLDRLTHRFGLHGKSFIPMLVGFGCTVPAIMATRILESRKDRLITMLVLPLMSCGARLPIYLLILGAFFPPHEVFRIAGGLSVTNQAIWLLAIYLVGILLSICLAKFLRSVVFRGEAESFVMELPPYRLPSVTVLLRQAWTRTWMYLKKAGTVILLMAILLWALKTWPSPGATDMEHFQQQRAAASLRADLTTRQRAEMLEQLDQSQRSGRLEHSAIGYIGRAIEPVLRPCGFDWRIDASLLGALAAREVFVSQMGVLYAVGPDAPSNTLAQKLAQDYTPLQGICILLFCLVGCPCIGTVAVTFRESGRWKWAIFQYFSLTALAWLLTTAVYQAGTLLLKLPG